MERKPQKDDVVLHLRCRGCLIAREMLLTQNKLVQGQTPADAAHTGC
jgi:hypothetical protein